jgi:nicotinic acid mononucleotide adenylyltransferase
MGADSWAEITTWWEWRRLLTLTNLIVVTRPGHEIAVEHVGAEIAANVLDLRGLAETEVANAIRPGAQHVFVTNAVMLDVSATEIRRAAGDNNIEELNRLVPLEVSEYIRKYRLYRNTNEA